MTDKTYLINVIPARKRQWWQRRRPDRRHGPCPVCHQPTTGSKPRLVEGATYRGQEGGVLITRREPDWINGSIVLPCTHVVDHVVWIMEGHEAELVRMVLNLERDT